MEFVKKTSLILLLLITLGYADDKPIEIKLFSGMQQQNKSDITSSGSGWLTGGEIGYKFTDRLSANLRVNFDYMSLEEDSVLLEWDWPYWDERYIDWMLTGATQEEVDSISILGEYWRSDSSYHGVFNDHQWIQELSFSLNLKYKQPITEKLSFFGTMGIGFNLYERRLKMVEDWWKTFTWSWDSTGIAQESYSAEELEKYYKMKALHDHDPGEYELNRHFNDDSTDVTYQFIYDYYTKVTHFAPSKKGTLFFLTPEIGLSYELTSWVDLELAYQGVWYFTGESVEGMENMVNIDSNSRKWFPFETKSMLTLGLTFKY